ncbi:MAG: glycoside hydrolase family 127 protein [Bacteroidetes bacterium]|nr:glycoside hydrolase family 127 protein [Bacteroidota bacterium]
MIRSLFYYAQNFSAIAASSNERSLLLEELKRFSSGKIFKSNFTSLERRIAAEKAVNWLLLSQKNMKDNGIGSYHLVNGWSSSYPETTGYIIPTLIEFSKKYNQPSIAQHAIDAANWLLEVQMPSGGWPGMRLADNKPETIFNTGQVIRGIMAVYEKSGEQKYLDAAIKATEWLCENQDESYGYWRKFAFLGAARVYDSYVDAPILQVYLATGNEKYKGFALRNLYWIIENKQLENGWFEDCDNTIKHNDRPILHTISYTIDGLLDSANYLNDDDLLKAAKLPADVLLDKFLKDGYLNGRFDKDWNGSEYMICTGCAQISIVWAKLFKIYKAEKYRIGVEKMNNILVGLQSRKNAIAETDGAISGSFPFWGKYEPFAFPNWATKYFIDALMLEEEIRQD